MLNSQDIKNVIKNELKKDKSKSVKEMCQVCGVNKNILSTMASGSMPTLDNLSKIADYLGVSVDYLIGRDNKNSTSDEVRSAIISKVYSMPDEQCKKFLDFLESLFSE
ncbi:MAG: helix-turn-helix transcriptional regulator [Ruminococcus sp.]|nr:helix-turn-helix transcriptional regulator [Ruminococcus sp.]